MLDRLGPTAEGAHATDEYVELESLVERTALIALLVVALWATDLRPELRSPPSATKSRRSPGPRLSSRERP